MEFKLQELSSPLVVSRIANVHYFEFTSQYQTTDDSHDFCELLYVDKGSVVVHADHYAGILGSNQLILHQANEVHSLRCGDDGHTHVIIIGFECHAKELAVFSHAPITLLSEHRKMLAEVMKEGTDLFAPPYDIPNTPEMKKRPDHAFGAEQMLKIHLESFLITLIRDRTLLQSPSPEALSNENKLAEICRYISEHYTDRILLDNVCFLFGTNRTTLCQTFREEYGISILNYIDKLRMEDAKRRLVHTQASITAISEQLGFNSIHYFCRYFKKHTGISPGDYRQHMQLEQNHP